MLDKLRVLVLPGWVKSIWGNTDVQNIGNPFAFLQGGVEKNPSRWPPLDAIKEGIPSTFV